MVESDQMDLMVTVPGMDPMAVEVVEDEETEEATAEAAEVVADV